MTKISDDIQLAARARQLDGLRDLADGWDSYDAPAPSADAIVQACGLIGELDNSGLAIAHVGPSVLGGVGITVEQCDTEYAIELRNSGKLVIAEISEDDDPTVHDLLTSSNRTRDILAILLHKGLH